MIAMNTHQQNMMSPDLSRDVEAASAEIKPVMGALHYGRMARAKLLITDLVQYVVREILEPLYPPLVMTEQKARGVFRAIECTGIVPRTQ